MVFEAKHPVKSLEKTLRLVDVLKTEGGARIFELVDRLDMGESAVHNHLATLREHGYVVKRGETYHLSMKFLDVGGYVQQREDLYRAAKPVVEELARETGERAELVIEQQGIGVQLTSARGREVNSLDQQTGARFELWNTPAGRTLLAHVPSDRYDEILDHRDDDETPFEGLTEDLEEIRNRGFAYGDHAVGNHRSLAVPIATPDGVVIGALGVLAPTIRKDDEWFLEAVLDLMEQMVSDVELNFKSMTLREAWIDSSTVQKY